MPGEDELKGYEPAIAHINIGHELIRRISPHITMGVLGKQIAFGVADSEAKPNSAVQAQSRFISENQAMMIAGSVCSAVAVAANKLAQREKVIYLPGITGSNDTTGKDCVPYSFRCRFYAQAAAAAIAPRIVKALGNRSDPGRLSLRAQRSNLPVSGYLAGDCFVASLLAMTVSAVRGKKPSAMKSKDDYCDIVHVVAGGPLMQKPDAFGCKLGDYT